MLSGDPPVGASKDQDNGNMHHVSAELIDALTTEATLRRQLLEHNAYVLQQGIQGYEKRSTDIALEHPKQQIKQSMDDKSQSALEQVVESLNTLAQRYRLSPGNLGDGLILDMDARKSSTVAGQAPHLLISIEGQFEEYKQQIRHLEREVKAKDEKERLESISRKKCELQLRAVQEKKEAAEARCKELENGPGRSLSQVADSSASKKPKYAFWFYLAPC